MRQHCGLALLRSVSVNLAELRRVGTLWRQAKAGIFLVGRTILGPPVERSSLGG